MSDVFNFVVVGTGWFGSKRLAALGRMKNASVASVVDSDESAGREAAKTAGADYSPDLEKALHDTSVDCVLVCTPNSLHPQFVVGALRKDKHVLCEKPLARNSREAKIMVDAAKMSKGFLKTGSNHRYFPNVARAIEIVKSGDIGEPIFLRGSIGHNGELLKGRWFWQPEIAGGGTFLDNGCHLLDLSRVILGDLNECIGKVSTTYWPVAPLEDNGFAIYSSGRGKTALVQSSWIEWYGYMYFEVYGSDGFVVVDSRRANRTLQGKRDGNHTTVYDYSDLPPRSHEFELADFLEHVKRGQQPSPSGEDGLRVVQMVEALYESSTSGRRIFLSP